MKTHFRFVLLFAVLVMPLAHAQDANTDIYGKWKITAVLGGASEADRQALDDQCSAIRVQWG